MCRLYAYKKHKENYADATYFHGGWPLPEDSNVNPLISLCVNIHFIDTRIDTLVKHISWHCLAYQDNMKEIFQNPCISC